jgi:predicted phosphodiesterase
MTVLLHLSDTHFGTEQVPVLEAVLDLAHELMPDIVVLSGDLTQRATVDQFRQAQAFLRRMPDTDWVIQPGNHDLPLFAWWERMRRPYGRYRRVLGLDSIEPVVDLHEIQITCVNTTRWWRQQLGALSHAQIDAVATRLCEARAGTWRIVSCHHPLAVQRDQDRRDRPWRHAQAVSRWRAAGMDLLLSGHIHVPALLPLHAPDANPSSPPCWLSQAGSACSRRLRAGQANSVTVLRQGESELARGGRRRDWTRWDYSDHHRGFVPVSRVDLGGGLRADEGLPLTAGAAAHQGAGVTVSEFADHDQGQSQWDLAVAEARAAERERERELGLNGQGDSAADEHGNGDHLHDGLRRRAA